MCGIIGMVGSRDVVPFLMDSLKRMEYRGYDSAGIAVFDDGKFNRRRAKGKLSALQSVVEANPLTGNIGIGHIRWASHGTPTEENAHPHKSSNVKVVHNGIIENWQTLRKELENKGYKFISDTDTEVVAHLIQSNIDAGLNATQAFQTSIKRLQGAYALAVMIESEPETLFVARLGSPLVVGSGENEMYVGSDALVLAPVTNKVQFLEEGDYAIITGNSIQIFDCSDTQVQREITETGLTADDTDKAGFPHFMLKEIHEQPKVLEGLIERYIDVENKQIKDLELGFDPKEIERFAFIACGTAYHAGMVGKYWMESLAKVSVDIDVASEYRYRDLIMPKKGVFVAISQSGETADTLAALRKAKQGNQHIMSVINVESSTMARESDDILPIIAGAEIGVASTKAFVAQCFTILCLSIWLGKKRGVLSQQQESELITDILLLPKMVKNSIEDIKQVQHVSYALTTATDVLFLGRGLNYPIALESSLKLKEISYIHAEGYASGEMKHGAIALIDKNVPVVCLVPNDKVAEKSLSNMQEVAAREAQVVLVSTKEICEQNNDVAHKIEMPEINPVISPILYIIPMQLLSYYTALTLGKDVDQPRNLAKSVTIE